VSIPAGVFHPHTQGQGSDESSASLPSADYNNVSHDSIPTRRPSAQTNHSRGAQENNNKLAAAECRW
jgi:hypothetical protein